MGRNGTFEDTHIGRQMTRVSNYINSWFDNKAFLFLSLLYYASIYLIGFLEQGVAYPDNKLHYQSQELQSFFEAIGYKGRQTYALYLGLESITVFALSMLSSFSVSFVAFTLVAAEEDMEKALDDEKDPLLKRHKYPFRAIALNILPVIFLGIELLENLLLVLAMYMPPNSGLMYVCSIVTQSKWISLRWFLIFTVVVMVMGWSRVLVHRLTFKPKKLPNEAKPDGPKNDKVNPFPGLSKANQITKQTWQGSKKHK